MSSAETKPDGLRTNAKAGAPAGNQNALRHGLTLGSASAADPMTIRHCNGFRRALEAALLALRGSISLADAAAVQTVVRLERHALLAQKWLREQGDKLTPVEKLKFSREITSASLERDRRLKALGIVIGPAKPSSAWDLVHNRAEAPNGR